MKSSFYSYTFKELETICAEAGLVPRSTSLMFNWYYKKNQRTMCQHHNLAKKTQDFIRDQLDFSLPKIHTVHESVDKTVKFLFELTDGKNVESVLIPFQQKYTICLSSQVGCSMKCSFCYTGDQGFARHLQTEEIVGQFLQAQQWLTQNRPDDDRILNIVYMGQGEPLHNFDAVRRSAEIFICQHGLSVAERKITISTSGYLPGMERWKQEMPNVNLALSLHAAFPEKRNAIIPINKKYPLDQVLAIADTLPHGKKRFVTYEYLVLKDFNDTDEDAHALGALLTGKKAYINLIPFNPYPGARHARPERDAMERFRSVVETYNIPTLIRTTKGDEILAACGQLNTKLKENTANIGF